jgi:hypothetical protein
MTKKKNKSKITVMQVKKKIRPFDLVGEKDESRIINAFLQLQATEGWALFVQMIEANLKIIDEQILTKKSISMNSEENNKPLKEEAVDRLRDKREIYLEMISIPNDTVQRKMKLDPPEEKDDPYYNLNDLPGKRTAP